MQCNQILCILGAHGLENCHGFNSDAHWPQVSAAAVEFQLKAVSRALTALTGGRVKQLQLITSSSRHRERLAKHLRQQAAKEGKFKQCVQSHHTPSLLGNWICCSCVMYMGSMKNIGTGINLWCNTFIYHLLQIFRAALNAGKSKLY